MNGNSKKFFIYRQGETAGIAGCQHIGEGIVFSSNKVAVNWLTGEKWPVVVYDNLAAAARDICRDGKTEIVPAEMPR
jgi:hypothetical protein